MHYSRERRLSERAITRILRQACLRAKQREDALYNRDLLDALQEMTCLPRSELAELARETTGVEDRFFSIGRQLLLASCFLLIPAALSIWIFMF